MEELLKTYHRNFPNNIRDEEIVKRILSNPDNHIIEKKVDSNLIGVQKGIVINKVSRSLGHSKVSTTIYIFILIYCKKKSIKYP